MRAMGRIFEVRKHAMFARWNRMAKQFTRVAKDIAIAVHAGGPDPAANPTLRRVLQNARAVNMPKDKTDAAIRRASGKEAANYQEIIYEGYAPHGVALLVETATDNPTRTVADVRHKMSRAGGNLGTPGSVSFMFEKKGQITLDATSGPDEDTLLELALEAGAEDFRREDDVYVVTTDPGSFHAVQAALEVKKVIPTESELAMVPKNTVTVSGKENVEALFKLIEALEELDDVQKVWANFDIDDADMPDL